MTTLFGNTWDDLRIMQNGSARTIDFGDAPTATAGDRRLLAEHGVAGLESKKFYGVLDRLQASGIITGYRRA